MNYNSKYVVRLTEDERCHLDGLINKGKVGAEKRRRAQILLKADAGDEGSGFTDREIAEALDVGLATVHRVRQAYVEQGFEAVFSRKPKCRHRPRILDGAAEAQLVVLTCSPAPEGFARWTLQLLANRIVELEIVPSISVSTIHRTLKKRAEALVETAMGVAERGRRGFRCRHGGYAGR
jgi:transposase